MITGSITYVKYTRHSYLITHHLADRNISITGPVSGLTPRQI